MQVVAPVGQVEPAEWRAELDTGYRDTADQAGEGLRATWPTDTPIGPIAAIDHVLVDGGCAIRSFDSVPLPGSDHRAVVAEIVLPR